MHTTKFQLLVLRSLLWLLVKNGSNNYETTLTKDMEDAINEIKRDKNRGTKM
jgi:hypothetical protein